MTALQLPTAFPDDVEASLRRLSPRTEQINRTFLRHVQTRSLRHAEQIQNWVGQQVCVFLRHDRVKAFTIMFGDVAAMADYVTLNDVSFQVDQNARAISNRSEGPLPNKRTVHAWLEGTLNRVDDHGALPDTETWTPIRYNPFENSTFVLAESGEPVSQSPVIQLVPEASKVWCPRREVSP